MTKSHSLQLIPTEVSGTADVQVDPHITTADLGTTSEVRSNAWQRRMPRTANSYEGHFQGFRSVDDV
jgi:hypothetical protein